MCEGCAFFEGKENQDEGLCRRNPPQVIVMDDGKGHNRLAAFFPYVNKSKMWCGEGLPRESFAFNENNCAHPI